MLVRNTVETKDVIKRHFALADALAELLRPHVEVVVHDLSTGKIVYLANAFSKRVVGDLSLNDDGPELCDADGFFGPYEKENADGRSLRSVTIPIRDHRNEAVGHLCINLDLSPFDAVKKAVDTILHFSPKKLQPVSLFINDWRDQINGVTARFLRERSRVVDALTKADRVSLVAEIDQAGLFEARGAAEYVARQLEISRAALYRYLSEARGS